MRTSLSFSSIATLAVLVVTLSSASGQPAVSVVTLAPVMPVSPGQTVTMAVSASGSAAGYRYQWKLNGTDIPGATAAMYQLTAAGAADRGGYAVVVTDSGGSVSLDLGTMTVTQSDARIVNLSARAKVGTGSNVLITGFVSQGGANSTAKNVMIRGMGPALLRMGMGMMDGLLGDPLVTVYDSHSQAMASDMGWMNTPILATGSGASPVHANIQPATLSMMNAMGAFAPASGSADSALMMSAPPGAYTAVTSGANNSSGIAIVECYDADEALGNGGNSARLVNMSGRAWAGSGAGVLIEGFVISPGPGHMSETVLLRAMGPGLSRMGVSGFLENPSMTLYDRDSKPIATNTGWGSAPVMATGSGASTVHAGIGPAMAAVMNAVGAFPAATGSADSAMVATLSPGAYTMVVGAVPDHSGNATTGVVLAEIYEVR